MVFLYKFNGFIWILFEVNTKSGTEKGHMMPGFIAVHVGAGYHAEHLRVTYKKACKDACSKAIEMINDGCNSVEAVAAAVTILEDCPLTNAGIGSSLTLKAGIECDASIMEGVTLNYAAVGCLCNIRNPIKVAEKLFEEQKAGMLACGRVPPCTLVGKGALDWALDHGFTITPINQFVTKTTRTAYVKGIKAIHNNCSFPNDVKEQIIPEDTVKLKSVDKDSLLDTVGAVCVDSFGTMSSAVSSGGLLLKQPGRIGQAAVYGAGCWAENSSESDKPNVASSVTGIGEYLIKTLFARESCLALQRNFNSLSALPDLFKTHYLQSPHLRNVNSKLGGVLGLKYYAAENACELAWAHNTKSMLMGYMSTAKRKPIAIESVQPERSQHQENIVGSERRVKLKS